MIKHDAVGMSGEASGGCGGHGVVDAVKNIHTGQPETEGAS